MDAFLSKSNYRRWVIGLGIAVGLAGRGVAQEPASPTPAPIVESVVPEGDPGTPLPSDVGVPETVQVPAGMDPYATPRPTGANMYRPSSPVLVNDQVWFAWYGNASRRAVLAPNMFGNISGTRSLGFSPFSVSVLSGGTPGTPATPGAPAGQLNATILDANTGFNAVYTAVSANTLTPVPANAPTYAGINIGLVNFTTTAPLIVGGVFVSPVPVGENPTVTQLVQNAVGKMATFNPASTAFFDAANPPGGNIYNINLVYDLSTFGTPGTPGTPGTTSIVPIFTLFLPNPSGGGIVGRTLVSTDNSPIPRDRFIAQYDFVAGSKVVPGGMDYNRVALGFEKTFFDGMTSLEVLLPFATTANSTVGDVTNGTQTELGNLFLNFKALLAGGDVFSLTTGAGVSLPTASDTRFRMNGVDLLRVNNQAILVTPYVAMLFTPTDRIFSQAWVGLGFDANGNPVQVNNGTGMAQIGKLNDPLTMQADFQVGYWLLHPARNCGFLRGLAPFFEFHYNGTLTREDTVSVGSVQIADNQGGFGEYNLSAGFVAQIENNVNLSVGASTPLGRGNNRYSDYQLGVRLNWFFGATGDARTRALPYY